MWLLLDVTLSGCDYFWMWLFLDVTVSGCDSFWMWLFLDVTTSGCEFFWMWLLLDVTTSGCDYFLSWKLDVTTSGFVSFWMWLLLDVTTAKLSLATSLPARRNARSVEFRRLPTGCVAARIMHWHNTHRHTQTHETNTLTYTQMLGDMISYLFYLHLNATSQFHGYT